MTALVALDYGICPVCRTPTEQMTVGEPALLRGGGYGADRVTVHEICPKCPYARVVSVSEARPWRR